MAVKQSLEPCPCGNVPKSLFIQPGDTCKYAWVSGNCCGDWNIEFRTDYKELNSEECMDIAIRAWNDAKRGNE